MLNTLINKAHRFAELKHEKQIDDNGKPHYLHGIKVACLLSLVTDDAELIAAGYLHDTLEDTDTTYDDLVREFGKGVADLVLEVTHVRAKDNRNWCFPNLKTRRAFMLKYADRLDNLSRMDVWNAKRIAQYMTKSTFWKTDDT